LRALCVSGAILIPTNLYDVPMKDTDDPIALTPELLLQAYAAGVFPMSESRDDPEVFWVEPRFRGVFPLNGFHISRSLARHMRRNSYTISFDADFEGVVRACADRSETWINDTIFGLYSELNSLGYGHSIEVWEKDELVGGVYGVAMGSAFFGESMFSRRDNASKVALAYLIDRLRLGGFTLFDTQFITPHLASLGAIEIPRMTYKALLNEALGEPADFHFAGDRVPSAQDVIQRSIQTS